MLTEEETTDAVKTFTCHHAVTEFEAHTGYAFHPTVPGQLMARRASQNLIKTRYL